MTKSKYFISLSAISLLLIVLYFFTTLSETAFSFIIIINFIVHYLFYQKSIFKMQYMELNNTIEDVLNGNMDANIVSSYVLAKELNANLNRLVKKMERMNFKKEEDELTIKILTNNITSPIIYIDRDGRIRYVNNQFSNNFDTKVEINEIYENLRIKKLYKFIDDAFIFEIKEIDVLLIGDRYYQANAIPVNNQFYNDFSFVGILFIFNDITEIKKYEKLQREFLADASHELKTPLSAIKGASEILLNGVKHSEETITDFLTIIKNENDRMERIVSDILLISRLENDYSLINKEKININKLLKESIDILSFKLDYKNQKLHLNLKGDLQIIGDYNKLKHAFLNLITNAINYTNEFKSIFIETYKKNQNIVVSIKDEGIGIDQKDIPHIFERFYRVDKARSRESGGTGLGLAIVKTTLDIHKAKIEVKSEIDKGTEFLIYFD